MRVSRTVPIAIGFSLVALTGAADATSTTCTTSTVCAEYINSSSGVAIHGEANSGIGIRGTSNTSVGFYGASRSGDSFFPGVEGESLNNTGGDAAGAFGLGTTPAYGVLAYGTVAGVFGEAAGPGLGTNGAATTITTIGVTGYDKGGASGMDSNVGVLGQSLHGAAIMGLGVVTQLENNFGTFPIGIAGDAETDGKNGTTAYGVEGISKSFPIVAYNPSNSAYVDLGGNGNVMEGSGGFYIDTSANVHAKSITTTKGTYVRTTGTSGTTRMSYSARTTAPVMEDFGEAQLVNGRGYVRLDPALSDVIDNRNAYHVFLTPEGDSKGLYVTQKSPGGFEVRESSGGRSTLAFEYRILAKPVDDDAKRLALAPPIERLPSMQERRPEGTSTPQQPLDPFARLAARLGPEAYARARKAARKIESGP